MSRATLQRKFKLSAGVAPLVYVNRWRMAKKHSNLSLEDVGFADARTFRTAFKKQLDLTPSEVRKN